MLDSLLNKLAHVWLTHPVFQVLGEGLLVSGIVFSVFLLLDSLLRKRLSAQSSHLLILGGFACVFLSLLMAFQPSLPANIQGVAPAFFTLTVQPGFNAASETNWSDVLLILYCVPVALLVLRLLLGLWRLKHIRLASRELDDAAVMQAVALIKDKLRISRYVSVRINTQIHSPVSFGVLRPVVLLPQSALQWTPQILIDVLSHELSHVQRCDSLSKLLCYGLSSLLWINPFAWHLLRRLDACAESACDSQAARLGGDSAGYASTLLSVARLCKTDAPRHPLFAQSMLDRDTLETRIVHLLEEKIMKSIELKKERRNVLFALSLFSVLLIVALANIQLVSAQSSTNNAENREPPATRDVGSRGRFEPLTEVIPMYPTAAAEQGVEGWVHVRFTVGTDGTVETDSISIVDAEPPTIFNASAVSATEKFTFTPYAPDGFLVIVPNVQYVFRYKLNDDTEE